MLKKILKAFAPKRKELNFGDFNRVTPLSEDWGIDRGGPIDRYYIEGFLERNKLGIKGRTLEIAGNNYTRWFGENRVTQSDILHIDDTNPDATIVADLTYAPQIADNLFDCIILTQTLHLIFDYESAIKTCHRILKPGGKLFMTVPGISCIDYSEWGGIWYWSFTDRSIKKIMSKVFDSEKTNIEVFGNVFAAAAFLYGVGLPEVDKIKLDYKDPCQQLIIATVATK